MRRFLLFVLAVMAFAACTNDSVEEQVAIRHEAPETITVGFEGDDTRIQLNEAQKTVWTKDDLVSVFYRSDANQKWQYQGETGERVGNLKRVDAGTSTRDMDRVVVVYPYNDNYYINLETYNIQASLPAVQSYLENSYGTDGNIMVSSSEYNQFSLKSVCGWLKLQLTGDGEVVKSIKFCGNNDEQVAGELYINSADATAMLASDMGDADDNNAGGNLVFDDTILTEVTLDCGEGVTLGAEVTTFYIALPPQTFEKGFTVVIESDGYKPKTLSTEKRLTIERNHIQPMATMEFVPPVPNNQIWYTSSDGNVVTPNYTDVFGAAIISNTYNNGKGVITFYGDVTEIGGSAFYNRKSLTSITISDSVTKIGDYAFSSCITLTSVTIPDSVTMIGDGAFANCSSLAEFKGKFAEDDGRILVVDDALKAFAPVGISEYTVPDSVTMIGESAFYNCYNLTNVTIPDSVTTIGDEAFYNCNKLTSINIPDGVTTIGEFAFDFCESLTSITIPNSVTTIGENVFANCYSLTSVTIGDGVTTIVNGAFAYCKSLTSVTIPDNVTTIGDDAFLLCERLTSITIPDSVTTIGAYAFSLCKSIESVTLPNSVTTIGNWAFNSCSSLTSVTIGDGVTTIGYGAFYYCNSLTSVYCKAVNPPALDGSAVFDFNGSGRKIYVPVKSADAYMSAQYWSEYASDIVGYDFENGTVMETVQNNEIWYTSSDGNVVTPNNRSAFGTNIVSNTYSNGKGIITFEGDVTKIGDEAFAYCPRLTSITIPYNVTTIGKNAFAYCTNLTEFKGKFAEDNGRILVVDGALKAFAPAGISEYTIHDSVKTIGDFAFYDCDSLTSITIPNSVKTIKGYTFYDCDNLNSVTIGNSVTTIGDGAFAYCYSLKSVYCKATTPPTLESSYVFYYNSSSLKIYVPTESVEAYKSATYWSEYANKIVGYNF